MARSRKVISERSGSQWTRNARKPAASSKRSKGHRAKSPIGELSIERRTDAWPEASASRLALVDRARAVLSRSSWGGVQQQQLSRKCRALWAKLQATCPDLKIERRLKAGEIAGDMTIGRKDLRELFLVAAGAKDSPQVVWFDGTNELLVEINRIAVMTADGLVRVTIPISCEETGRHTVQVTFATGSLDSPSGLVFATDTIPKGPPEVVEMWGEALVALAWTSLLRALSALAGVAGADEDGAGLVPAGLTADRSGVTVTVIARHPMDRLTR